MNLFFTARILTSEPEYNSSLIEYEIDKTKLQEREQLLKEKKKRKTLPQLSFITQIQQNTPEHWHLVHITPNLAEIFQNPPILAFCRNKNLRHYW